MISPIERMETLMPGTQPAKPKSAWEDTEFGMVFRSAIDQVKETDREMSEAEYLLATGQLDNPAAVTIAATKNEVAVSLLIQLRNKAMDAYSEIMRTSM